MNFDSLILRDENVLNPRIISGNPCFLIPDDDDNDNVGNCFDDGVGNGFNDGEGVGVGNGSDDGVGNGFNDGDGVGVGNGSDDGVGNGLKPFPTLSWLRTSSLGTRSFVTSSLIILKLVISALFTLHTLILCQI